MSTSSIEKSRSTQPRKALKRTALCLGGFVLGITLLTTTLVLSSGDKTYRYRVQDNVINDITGLNPVHVTRVIRPTTIEQITKAIQETSGPISIGGGRFSQGGQTAYPNSLHLDMRSLNRVLQFNPAAKLVTVQSGITWRALQDVIDPANLSVSIMQTYANFTVGGSLSVNSHGRYMGEGPIVRSVESLRLVLADGTYIEASPNKNSQLFYAAIGGYGGIGIIVDVTLRLTDNIKIERRTNTMPVTAYKQHFFSSVRNAPNIVMHNADIYPPYFTEVRDVSWYRSEKELTNDERLIPGDRKYSIGPRLAEFDANYTIGKWLRQYVFDPMYYRADRVVWRNWEASYDVRELPVATTNMAYGLREYFVPVEKFNVFLPKMREVFRRHEANVLNVSIRHAKPDPGTLLAWARTEVFAFVVYYAQGTTPEAQKKVDAWSRDLVDAVLEVGGTYYLPYQNAATPQQFLRAYPHAGQFFAIKERFDPDNRFRNQFWQKYYRKNEDPLTTIKQTMPQYFRGGEQTVLTIPEWYLVFNPVEYANFLDKGNNPSDFPFFASINEYWTLYDRAKVVAAALQYPQNSEYITMLRVIGISTTVEYALKGIYENTIGRLTRWSAGGRNTPEDLIITRAQRAYSELIFVEPWYKFAFWPWVNSIWSEPSFFGKNFIRKLERKFALTLEFGIKTAYAWLIQWAAESTYGVTEKAIYLSARKVDVSKLPQSVSVLHSKGEQHILAVPRWGGFTETMPKLLATGVDVMDISGNHQIALSVLVDAGGTLKTPAALELFRSPLVSSSTTERVVLMTKVTQLANVLHAITNSGGRLEHIYDY